MSIVKPRIRGDVVTARVSRRHTIARTNCAVNSVLPAKAPAFALSTGNLPPVVSPISILPCLRLLPPQPPNFSICLCHQR